MYHNLTAYTLLAITVVSMVAGHVFYYFYPDALWLRIPDRILVPTFLVLIGYNVGRKSDFLMWFGAIVVMGTHLLLYHDIWINVLGTFILVRALIDPIMYLLLRSKFWFWFFSILFVVLSPVANHFFEYGTIAFTMAMAGWINRNRDEAKHIVDPDHYFIFATIGYIFFTQVVFHFSQLELMIIITGTAVTMILLYDFRTLLMNSIRRRPRDLIEKTVSFIGRKSLEIYVIHVVLFEMILYAALHRSLG